MTPAERMRAACLLAIETSGLEPGERLDMVAAIRALPVEAEPGREALPGLDLDAIEASLPTSWLGGAAEGDAVRVALRLISAHRTLLTAMAEARGHLETWERQAGPGHPLGAEVAAALAALFPVAPEAPASLESNHDREDADAIERAALALLASLGEYVRQSMDGNPEWSTGARAVEAAVWARQQRRGTLLSPANPEPTPEEPVYGGDVIAAMLAEIDADPSHPSREPGYVESLPGPSREPSLLGAIGRAAAKRDEAERVRRALVAELDAERARRGAR